MFKKKGKYIVIIVIVLLAIYNIHSYYSVKTINQLLNKNLEQKQDMVTVRMLFWEEFLEKDAEEIYIYDVKIINEILNSLKELEVRLISPNNRGELENDRAYTVRFDSAEEKRVFLIHVNVPKEYINIYINNKFCGQYVLNKNTITVKELENNLKKTYPN